MCLDGDAQIDWVLGANSVVGGWVGSGWVRANLVVFFDFVFLWWF